MIWDISSREPGTLQKGLKIRAYDPHSYTVIRPIILEFRPFDFWCLICRDWNASLEIALQRCGLTLFERPYSAILGPIHTELAGRTIIQQNSLFVDNYIYYGMTVKIAEIVSRFCFTYCVATLSIHMKHTDTR